MKKILVLAAILALGGMQQTAFASTPTAAKTRMTPTSVSKGLNEDREAITKHLASRAKSAAEVAISRLEKIATRIDSRIAKVKAGGTDTTRAEEFVASARTHIASARNELKAFAAVDISAGKLSENIAELHELSKRVKYGLGEAHYSLQKAVQCIKTGECSKAEDFYNN